MAIRRHAYHFQDGKTDLSAATFNAIFVDLDARLHALEQLGVSWKDAVRELQQYGLERINGALAPVLEETQRNLEALQTDQSSFSAWWEAVKEDVQDIHAAAAAMQTAVAAITAKVEAYEASTQAALDAMGQSLVPVGVIVPFAGGYFTGTDNSGYTPVWGNTVADINALLNPKGWYVCDGAELNLPESPLFNGPGRRLPNLTDDRFIMGSGVAGGIGGENTTTHSHTIAHYHHVDIAAFWSHNTTLTVAQMPHHGHQEHGEIWANVNGGLKINNNGTRWANTVGSGGRGHIYTAGEGGNGAHAHIVDPPETATTGPIGNPPSGEVSLDNRPRFLGCFYIMRVR